MDGPEVYDWYVTGVALLDQGSAGAAAVLLERAAAAEPASAAILEALARAKFATGRVVEAAADFRVLADRRPDDDFAQYGVGLCASRLGDFETAADHLAMAVVLRPGVDAYERELRHARATLRARRAADRRPSDSDGP